MRGRPTVAWAAASVAWMAVIFGLSSLSGSAVPLGEFASPGHFVLYATLGGLYFLTLRTVMTRPSARVVAVVLASLYGLTDEFHQAFVPGRMPDPADWLVDTAGAVVGVLVVHIALKRMRRNSG
ncbi:MAG: VanZ family protein [Coriobacteriia bacterium]|nr:VanZ family protein [Coriobacteriia bacterium]